MRREARTMTVMDQSGCWANQQWQQHERLQSYGNSRPEGSRLFGRVAL
jgi:hypothetical protein